MSLRLGNSGNSVSSRLASISDILIQSGIAFLIIFSAWFYGGVEVRHQAVVGMVSLFLLLIWMFKRWLIRETSFVNTPLNFPLIVFFLLTLIYTLFSVYRHVSLRELYKFFPPIFLYFLAVNNLKGKSSIKRFIWLIVLTGTFYAGYGILQYAGFIPKSFWADKTSLASRFVNSNHFAGFLELTIFAAGGILLFESKIWRGLLAALCLGIMLVAFAYTRSRSGWLSLIIAMVFFGILLTRRREIISRRRWLLLSGLAVMMLVVVGILSHATIATRLGQIRGTQYYSVLQRRDIWKGTLTAFLHHPWGTGLGTFSTVYPQYRIHSDRFVVNYAHNEYLQLALEMGIAGLAAGFWLLLRYFRGCLRTLKGKDKFAQALTIGLLSGSLSILIHSLFDFELHIPANALLFSFVVALAMSVAGEGPLVTIPAGWKRKTLSGLGISISLLLAIGLTRTYRADGHYRRGAGYEKNFQWSKAIKEYQKAISLNTGSSLYRERVGTLYALRGSLNPKSTWNERAITSFQQALDNNPRNANAHVNLAWLYAGKKEKDKALEHFRKAVLYDPTNGAHHLAYANYCLEQSLLKESFKEFKKALSLFIIEERAENIQRIFARAYEHIPDYEKLKNLIPNTAEIHLRFGQFLVTKGRRPEAYKEFKKALDLDPENKAVIKAMEQLQPLLNKKTDIMKTRDKRQ